MKDLIESLKIRKKYNNIPYDEFIEMLEKFIGEKIPDKDKEMFKFSGLLNTDFFIMHQKTTENK